MSAIPGHNAVEVKIETLPFYRSLKIVAQKSGLSEEDLMGSQAGFKATPDKCPSCAYEWNAFDAIINTVEQGPHDWAFIATKLGKTGNQFFYRKIDMNCPTCGVRSDGIGILYKYQPTKWNSDVRGKEDVVRISNLPNGLGVYTFRYKGEKQSYVGLLAQEVLTVVPQAVFEKPDGYLMVDYDMVGFEFQTLEEYEKR